MLTNNKPDSSAVQWNRWFVCLLLCGSLQSAFAGPYTPAREMANKLDPALGLQSEVFVTVAKVTMPDLTGTWVLDKEASDDPEAKLKVARSDRARPATGDRGDGGFGRRPGDTGRPAGGRESNRKTGEGRYRSGGRADSGVMAELSVKTLEIVHQEPLLTVTTDRQGTRKLYTDFRGASVSAQGGMDQQVVTGGWEGDVLVIEITSAGGEHIVQRLRLLDEPLRLERVTELPGRDENSKAIQVKQIFLPKNSLDRDNKPQRNSVSSDISWLDE